MKLSARPAIVWSLPGALFVLGAARAQTPMTERVSMSTTGVQSNGPSSRVSLSADGRFVAFESTGSNLVAGDTNATFDVFVRDRLNGSTQRVSVATAGTQANGPSYYVSISADGRFVAFSGGATNLVAGDTNVQDDVFVHDRQSGITERVSVNSAGVEGNNFSGFPSVSADGRFVAFCSAASNLVAGDNNGYWDYFVRDRSNGTTERVSVSTGGVEGDTDSYGVPKISADGRYVAFHSIATNLVAGDTNGWIDVFVRDRQNATTERVSVSTAGVQGDHTSQHPSISADGRFVAFVAQSSTLVPGDTNVKRDIFVRDRQSGTTERVSLDSAGTQSNGNCDGAAISADGRFVVFFSEANNLVAGDTNSRLDTFVHDRNYATTERASVDSAGVEGNGDSYTGAVSADGRLVTIESSASNLVAGDTNGVADVFVRDRGLQAPLVYCTSSTSSSGCSATIDASANPRLSHTIAVNLSVTNVEGLKFGLLFYGIDNSAFLPTIWAPGSTSVRCVKYPAQRTAIQNSGGTYGVCDGSFVLDWTAYQAAHPFALGSPWSVGDHIYAQAWFRDPPAPKGTNLSNAVEMTYMP